ncbi:metal-dependent hydrolase [Geodermatophilus sp. CPCC 205761]|uniref:metal-dependent hydrolase n=1 Tax=Geodermatophilus sp. CPCC 205761 TaxID=2936597 RepID=UPI003F538702
MPRPSGRARRSWGRAVLPWAALAVLAALDLVAESRWWPVPVAGLLDEPAHLITAGLVLAAVAPAAARPFLLAALVGSVAIDVDHVPLYLVGDAVAGDGGRPVTHSLAFVLLLLAAAAAVRRYRLPLAGLACGVALHLLRDLATGPGVPLLWPWPGAAQLPYALYAGVLVAATLAATARALRTGGHPSGGHSVVGRPVWRLPR